MKSTTKWVAGHQSVVDNGRAHSIVIDLPKPKGGDDWGATALELCVMSLSGCIGTIFTTVGKKMRLDLKSLVVDLDAEKPDEAPTVTRVNATVTVDSSDSTEKLQKCLDRTMDICPVGKLFEQACIPMDVKLAKA